jgi:hypothetical protein
MCVKPASSASLIASRVVSGWSYDTCRWIERVIVAGSRPVCGQLLEAAAAAGEIRPGLDPYELLRGVGSLCAGAGSDPRYNPRHLVELLIAGLRIQ